MSIEILDCLKRKRDICIKNIIPSRNTAFMWIPALRNSAKKARLSKKWHTYFKIEMSQLIVLICTLSLTLILLRHNLPQIVSQINQSTTQHNHRPFSFNICCGHKFVPGHKKSFWFCSETFCVRNKCFPVCVTWKQYCLDSTALRALLAGLSHHGSSLGDFVADVFFESLKRHAVHAHEVLKR